MATNVAALQSAVKIVADAIKDTLAALQPGQSLVAKVLDFENLVTDVAALIPVIGDIPSEVKAMAPTDAVALVDGLVVDLAISNEHAKAIAESSVKLLSDLAIVIVPDVQALIAAIKAPATAAAVAAVAAHPAS